ncbi:hypothetical protein MPRS_45280 [Mycobacterium paraseoulense]|nr:hypothetical protein MPRS_45280 [Mycobacterium paraseoulense]
MYFDLHAFIGPWAAGRAFAAHPRMNALCEFRMKRAQGRAEASLSGVRRAKAALDANRCRVNCY